MGLDIVEFIMRVEERFGIEIANHDAEKLTTPRKLVDYIMTKVTPGADRGCLTQREFYRLRRALIARRWTTREALRPDTPLKRIVPKANRTAVWKHLGEELQVPRWPGLRRPTLVTAGVILASIAAFLWPWLWRGAGFGARESLTEIMSLVSLMAVVWVGVVATRPLKVAIPRQYAGAGDVARALIVMKPSLEHADDGWTREQVRETVRSLIIEQIAVTEFSDDSHFVQDMRLD